MQVQVTDSMRKAAIFHGMTDQEIGGMLPCLNAMEQQVRKDTSIYGPGDKVRRVGLVIEGKVRIEKIDYWGNRKILAVIEPGQTFGEAYAGLEHVPMEMEVIAAEDSTILFMEMAKILMTCSSSCAHHARMIRNLVYALAERNHKLTQKMDHLTQKSTRDKLLSYFSEQAMANGSDSFDIPLDRQQLADYLSVDRSAMSTELGKMKKEGLLDFRKNHFVLYDVEL